MGGNNEFFENFERNKYLKKLPSMQRVKLKKKLYFSVNHIRRVSSLKRMILSATDILYFTFFIKC